LRFCDVEVNDLGADFPLVLSGAVAGDRSAFAQLWRSAHPGLLRYLKVVCGEDAEDVASQTWLKVIRTLPTFTGDESSFRGWLAVIARNTAIDHVRRASRRHEIPEATVADHRVDTAPDAADEALDALSTQKALDLVATLPPPVAEMVMLRVVFGLDVAQVAALVGRTPGAVRVAVHRGLKSLATTLEQGPEASGRARL
jgi:RNA polymerase sigma-70 factor, ECF subfamily